MSKTKPKGKTMAEHIADYDADCDRVAATIMDIVETENPQEVSAQTMLGDLMHLVVESLKAMPKSWQEMGESQQEDFLYRIETQCKEAVRQCVQIIAAEGQIRIPVTIKQTTIKDGVVCQVEFIHSSQIVQMIEAQTKTGMLVLVNSDNFLNEDSKPKADPQQKALDVDLGGDA